VVLASRAVSHWSSCMGGNEQPPRSRGSQEAAAGPAELGDWASLPPGLGPYVLDMLAVEDAGVLVSVGRAWRAHVEESSSFQARFESALQELMEATTSGGSRWLRRLQMEMVSSGMPQTFRMFVLSWIRLENVVGSRAHPLGRQQGLQQHQWRQAQPDDPPLQKRQWPAKFDVQHAYFEVQRRCAVKDDVLKAAKLLALGRAQLYADDSGPLMWLLAITIFFFAPQGLLWLALRADGIVHCPWSLGAGIGLIACLFGGGISGWYIWSAARIMRLRRGLRRLLGAPIPTNEPLLLQDLEMCPLVRSIYWLCFASAATAWLVHLVVSPFSESLLPAAAGLSLSSAVCATIALRVAQRACEACDISAVRHWLQYHAAFTWLLAGLTAARRGLAAAGRSHALEWQLAALGVSLAPALTIMYADAAATAMAAWRTEGRLGAPLNCKGCVGLIAGASAALLLHGALALVCGRCVGARWARRVPLTALAAPLQLPLIVGALIEIGATASSTAGATAWSCSCLAGRCARRCMRHCCQRCTLRPKKTAATVTAASVGTVARDDAGGAEAAAAEAEMPQP